MVKLADQAYAGAQLGRILVRNGAIPIEEVRDVQLLIPVDGVLTLRIDVNVTGKMLDKVIEAMQELRKVT